VNVVEITELETIITSDPILMVNFVLTFICVIYYFLGRRTSHSFIYGYGHTFDGNPYFHTIILFASLISIIPVIAVVNIISPDPWAKIEILGTEIVLLLFILFMRETSYNEDSTISYNLKEFMYFARKSMGKRRITDQYFDDLTDNDQNIVKNHPEYKIGYDAGIDAVVNHKGQMISFEDLRFCSLEIYAYANGFRHGRDKANQDRRDRDKANGVKQRSIEEITADVYKMFFGEQE
jgi:hypothetical protein